MRGGGIKSEFCNIIAKELWVWLTSQSMWVSAAHIPGTQNMEADSCSRNFTETIDWKLSTHLFQKISSMFGNPKLDLIASRINFQIHRYISWKPGLKALAIDMLFQSWNTEFYYIFPPFSLLGKVTAKNIQMQNKSNWSYTQMTHTTLVPEPLEKSNEKHDYITPSAKNLVQPQDPQKVHPLHQKLHL